MQGFCKRVKVNGGVHIEGRGHSIDVMIIDIIVESNSQKQVFFRVEGFEGLETFMLDYQNADMNRIPGLKMGVAERSDRKKSGGKRGKSVNLSFLPERGYHVRYRDYYGTG